MLEVAALFGIPAAALGYWLVTGLRSGVIQSRGGPIPRADYPVNFWMCVALYGFFFVIFAGLFIHYMADMLLHLPVPLL